VIGLSDDQVIRLSGVNIFISFYTNIPSAMIYMLYAMDYGPWTKSP